MKKISNLMWFIGLVYVSSIQDFYKIYANTNQETILANVSISLAACLPILIGTKLETKQEKILFFSTLTIFIINSLAFAKVFFKF